MHALSIQLRDALCCRFFFISDDELLSVLGTADPTSIQEHMLKLFDNCASLTFSRGNKAVNGMTSSEVRALTSCLPAGLHALLVSYTVLLVQPLQKHCLYATAFHAHRQMLADG